MKPEHHPFIKGRGIVIVGRVLPSFWQKFEQTPAQLNSRAGSPSCLVGFSDRNGAPLWFYPEPTNLATAKYAVTLRSGTTTARVEGYTVPDLIDILMAEEQVRPLGIDDDNLDYAYEGVNFLFDGTGMWQMSRNEVPQSIPMIVEVIQVLS